MKLRPIRKCVISHYAVLSESSGGVELLLLIRGNQCDMGSEENRTIASIDNAETMCSWCIYMTCYLQTQLLSRGTLPIELKCKRFTDSFLRIELMCKRFTDSFWFANLEVCTYSPRCFGHWNACYKQNCIT